MIPTAWLLSYFSSALTFAILNTVFGLFLARQDMARKGARDKRKGIKMSKQYTQQWVAAAKQNRSNVEQEPSQCQDSPSSTFITNNANNMLQGITEFTSYSEENLKEITPPPTTPQVTIQQPAGMSQPHAEISSNQYGLYHNEMSQFIERPKRVPMVTCEDEVGEVVPSSQRKEKRKTRASEGTNTEILNNGDYELTAVNINESAHAGQDSVDAVTPRKKKKRKVKDTASDILPPVVVRRPLPQLLQQGD